MINKLRNLLIRQRYNLTVFFLLNIACAVCVSLVVARIAYSDSTRHTGLLWNLFLAWIPFILSYAAHIGSWRRSTLIILIPILSILWFIFFPNAPYMLTDLQDLARRAVDAPLWYDVIILVWCSWTAMLLGVVSLYLMQDIIHRTINRLSGWLFVFIISGLSSFGMYIGRFVRLNSWDILLDPAETAITILGLVVDPSRRIAVFTFLYTIFFLFVYILLYSFSHFVHDQDLRAEETPDQLASTRQTNAYR